MSDLNKKLLTLPILMEKGGKLFEAKTLEEAQSYQRKGWRKKTGRKARKAIAAKIRA